MLNKILCFILLGAFVGLASVEAQSTPAKVKGRIIIARVEGSVSAVSTVDSQSRVLHYGDQVSDQTLIVTADKASVILVFSNGATVDLAGNSTLNIEEFIQDPFSAEIKVSSMKEEPGTSITRLNVTKGELVGKVVHLNVDRGSEFTVNTPVGAAGIRGTTFRIIFRPDPNTGKAYFVVTTLEGMVVFKGVTSAPVSIPAGTRVAATFDYTAPTATSPGSTVQGTPVTITTTNISASETSEIQAASQTIVSAVDTMFLPPYGSGNGEGNGGNGNGNGKGGGNGNNNSNSTSPFVQPLNPAVVSPSH